ncbi:glycosyltransferase family 4 protein [Dongia deserti]|uniref:glycosyltransferase family 4 protein n=1 Tax=Dongia deserti TaxID=2268030 RepID=UPI000E64B46E|nr:glycosyltransferase family 1 protein [Dongia deserti]
MHLALVTDAWAPQVNGVVRTLQRTKLELERLGHLVDVISPDQFFTVPCPTYPEIRLALWPAANLGKRLDALMPDAIHIATEGPLGRAARAWCLKRRLPFTTAYHTRFPEYVAARWAIPLAWTYAIVRRFHAPAARVMVATQSIENELIQRGFTNISRWTRGVDLELFRPDERADLDLPRPIHLYVGRVAVEKNIGAFLALKLPGSKVVIGDGPQLAALKTHHPDVHFLGAKHGADLARHVAAGDVFVFPSLTDTFGLVMLEALACGLPVAAFPVAGPQDVVREGEVGALDWDLTKAVERAIALPRAACRLYAQNFSWEAATRQFLANLAPVAADYR